MTIRIVEHRAHNAREPLAIETYVEKDDVVVHPSVVDGGVDGWNGHRYWMAATPLTDSNDQYENPSLWVSQDGETWVVPNGVTNPLYGPPAAGFYSDVHLVLHDGTLHLFWRVADNIGTTGERILLATSTDGVTWPAEPTVVLSNDHTVRMPLSPAVVRDGNGTWRMWTVDVLPGGASNTIDLWTASTPEGPWTGPTGTALSPPSGHYFWHIDVQLVGSTYHMLINTQITAGAFGRLYVATSGDGGTWQMDTEPAMVGRKAGDWDQHLYRSCWLPRDLDDNLWWIWYGSQAPYYIGFTTLDR